MTGQSTPSEVTAFIKEQAALSGFDRCGITPAATLGPESNIFRDWLGKDYHGQLSYLSNNFEKRTDPSILVPGAKSVVVCALNYYAPADHLEEGQPIISRYAYGDDYHNVIRQKLSAIMGAVVERYPFIEGRFFVDTAPLLEKPLAARAGLGWQGKNSLLIVKGIGSFVFLGELVLNIELIYDKPFATDHCGNCTRCISACPTGAIKDNRTIDARRCISYLTVELNEDIPGEFSDKVGERLFGCDICQEVCPWNSEHPAGNTDQFEKREYNFYSPEEWSGLTPDDLERVIKGTAIERAGAEKVLGNLKILRDR